MNKVETSKRLILNALLRGSRLTSYDANVIGKTTEGGRFIRFIRESYPVLKEQVPGELYYRYYIDPEWLSKYNEYRKRPLSERLKTFFEDLMDGGMFEGMRV